METNFYRDSEAVHLFIHLVLKANHRGRCFMFNGRLINVGRGQILTGRKILSAETGISEQAIRSRIQLFIDNGIIHVKATNKYSIITICHYDNYQGNDEGKRIQATGTATNTEPTDNQQITTNKNVKNDKECKELIRPQVDGKISKEAVQLANRLKELMKQNKPDIRIPPDGKLFQDADKLLRIDKRPFGQAMGLLEWCQKDSFWATNILSMKKFREKYDQLFLKAESIWKKDHKDDIEIQKFVQGVKNDRRNV